MPGQRSQLGFPGADILPRTSSIASSDGQGRLNRLIGQRTLFLCRSWNMQKRNTFANIVSWFEARCGRKVVFEDFEKLIL